MGRVVLKGELHTSGGDQEAARALLDREVDALVLEGRDPAASSGHGRSDAWFSVAALLLFRLLAALYASRDELVDRADALGVEVVYTRGSDTEIVAAAPTILRATAAAAFYGLVALGVLIGLSTPGSVSPRDVLGAGVLFAAVWLPIVSVRAYNSSLADPDRNREAAIAETIAAAASGDRIVLAVLGASHVAGVRDRLPSEHGVEVRPPVYGRWSRAHVREVAVPVAKAGLALFAVYLVTVWAVASTIRLAVA